MPTLILVDETGSEHRLDVRPGRSVMEVLRDAGYPIDGDCNGSLACATCHVWVDETWTDRLADPSEAEEDMLDVAFHLRTTSRLSCQIPIAEDLDGLKVRIPVADSPD